MNKTKAKIISRTITLYNAEGMVNVRLQHIADACGISLGNLTYHYKNKSEIMTGIYSKMMHDLQTLAFESKLFEEHLNGKEIAMSFLAFQWQYRFFYIDTIEIIRAHPNIKESHQIHVRHDINVIKKLLLLGIGQGWILAEPTPGIYNTLAEQLWMMMGLRLTFCEMRGIGSTDLGAAMKSFLNILYPFLTDKGKAEYQDTMEALQR